MALDPNKLLEGIFHEAAGTYNNYMTEPRKIAKAVKNGAIQDTIGSLVSTAKRLGVRGIIKKIGESQPFN